MKNYKSFILENNINSINNHIYGFSDEMITLNEYLNTIKTDCFNITSVYRNPRFEFYEKNKKPFFYAHNNEEYLYEIILKNYNYVELTTEESFDVMINYIKEKYDKNYEIDNSLTLSENYNIIIEKILKLKTYYNYDAIDIINEYMKKNNIYLLKCNMSLNPSLIKTIYTTKQNIKDLILINTKSDFDSEKDYTNKEINIDTQIYNILDNFMSKTGNNIDKKAYGLFDKYKPEHDIILYRGLSWNMEKLYLLKQFDKYPLELNDIIDIKFNRATSWTTNLHVAKNFAYENLFNIVIKRSFTPDEIIVDTRKFDSKILSKLYSSYQREVIVKPGNYNCEIIEIGDIFNGNDLKTGFNLPIDINKINILKENFEKFAKKFITSNKNNYNSLTYLHKNQTIFGDYAVEHPLIKVKSYNNKYGVVEYSIFDETVKELKFKIFFTDWKNYKSDEIVFATIDEMLEYILEYNQLQNKINTFYL